MYHGFQIAPKMILFYINKLVHENASSKLFAISYQFCAAIQQIGCGLSGVIQLAGFLEMTCGDRI